MSNSVRSSWRQRSASYSSQETEKILAEKQELEKEVDTWRSRHAALERLCKSLEDKAKNSSGGLSAPSPQRFTGAPQSTGTGASSKHRFFEYFTLLGTTVQTAELAWDNALQNMKPGMGLEDLAGYCFGEKLLCFPGVPPVEGIEDFCFPLHVPVTAFVPPSDSEADERIPVANRRQRPPQTPKTKHTHAKHGWMGRSVFLLSTGEYGQDKLYGVCLYWNEPFIRKNAEKDLSGICQSRKCFCLLTKHPFFDIHYKVLSMLVQDRAFHVQQMLDTFIGGGSIDGFSFEEDMSRNIISTGAIRLLQAYYAASVPGPELCGPSVQGTSNVAIEGHVLPFMWDHDDELKQDEAAAVQLGMPYIFGHLSMSTIITLVTALLIERRIVVQCADLAVLTAIVMAVPWLVRPYVWQTSFIPLVPPSLYNFLSAPVPFIAGILTQPVSGYDEGVIVLQVESDQVLGTEDLPRLSMLDDLIVKLGPPHDHLSALANDCDFSRRMKVVDPSTQREVIDGMLVILSSQIRSIVSLRELQGYCLETQTLTKELELTEEAKKSWLHTKHAQERPFLEEMLCTQMFQIHFMNDTDTIMLANGDEGIRISDKASEEQEKTISELSRQLARCTRRLARVEQEKVQIVQQKDKEIESLKNSLRKLQMKRPPTSTGSPGLDPYVPCSMSPVSEGNIESNPLHKVDLAKYLSMQSQPQSHSGPDYPKSSTPPTFLQKASAAAKASAAVASRFQKSKSDKALVPPVPAAKPVVVDGHEGHADDRASIRSPGQHVAGHRSPMMQRGGYGSASTYGTPPAGQYALSTKLVPSGGGLNREQWGIPSSTNRMSSTGSAGCMNPQTRKCTRAQRERECVRARALRSSSGSLVRGASANLLTPKSNVSAAPLSSGSGSSRSVGDGVPSTALPMSSPSRLQKGPDGAFVPAHGWT